MNSGHAVQLGQHHRPTADADGERQLPAMEKTVSIPAVAQRQENPLQSQRAPHGARTILAACGARLEEQHEGVPDDPLDRRAMGDRYVGRRLEELLQHANRHFRLDAAHELGKTAHLADQHGGARPHPRTVCVGNGGDIVTARRPRPRSALLFPHR